MTAEAGLASLAHKRAVSDLRATISSICAETALGATKTGSRSKAALELARALTVAVTLERRLLGLEEAGGEAKGPGVVIVVPQVATPAEWSRQAREVKRRIPTVVRDMTDAAASPPPPPAAEGDPYPDLEDDE